jgi:manganese transport protein
MPGLLQARRPVVKGFFAPDETLVTDSKQLYIALGILGATVMPHNLYLHSSVVQTRHVEDTAEAKRCAVRGVYGDVGGV